MGADHVLKVNTDDPKQLADEIEQVLGEQPDVSIECSGVDFSFRTAIHVSNFYCLILFTSMCQVGLHTSFVTFHIGLYVANHSS